MAGEGVEVSKNEEAGEEQEGTKGMHSFSAERFNWIDQAGAAGRN